MTNTHEKKLLHNSFKSVLTTVSQSLLQLIVSPTPPTFANINVNEKFSKPRFSYQRSTCRRPRGQSRSLELADIDGGGIADFVATKHQELKSGHSLGTRQLAQRGVSELPFSYARKLKVLGTLRLAVSHGLPESYPPALNGSAPVSARSQSMP